MSTSRLIAVSATAREWEGAERVRLHVNYVRSLEAAGLVPVIVPPLGTDGAAAEILATCGGLLLTGGEDVEPSLYGAARHPKCGATNAARDATEVALYHAARGRKLPVLAICRGIQVANAAMGGTLYQDLPSEKPSSINHDPDAARGMRTHPVSVTGGTRLSDAVGSTALDVNSYHHQAVNRLATGLRLVATAPDGVVEGVESDDPAWWMVAVQWHPEDLTTDGKPWDRGLFATFARVVQHGG